ncbi:MAG: prephenate dehydrogenase [Candidatus Goldiibacteriota bacterium]
MRMKQKVKRKGNLKRKFLFNNVVIIGMGFMGGSLGKTLLEKKIARTVTGAGRDMKKLKAALKMKAATDVTDDLDNAGISGADAVIISVPVKQIPVMFKRIKKNLGKNTVVTDMGSVKGYIAEHIRKYDTERCFVGSHPMVGSEKSGVRNSQAGLFENGVCVVTPEKRSSPVKVKKIIDMWKAAGMITVKMPLNAHDSRASGISHLPHFLSFVLVRQAAGVIKDSRKMIGPGFRDATRIAASDENVWSEIFETNKKELLKDIYSFEKECLKLRGAVEKDDFKAVKEYIRKARILREKI